MLGEVEDLWDQVAVAMYPSRKAMLKMITVSRLHRERTTQSCGFLEGQLNIKNFVR
ncbi:MAG: hypothetical protein Ct9H90mP4_01530 [Gammaproteobacteria bacterium]|nr:MAG: hypothetical protein Ct9H90mP4_01530 [Gammaproteobacteria bacterium]